MPPQGDETALAAGRVEVERARRVAGDAFFMKGHMALDCRRTASMVAASIGVVVVLGVSLGEVCTLRMFWLRVRARVRRREDGKTGRRRRGGGRIRGLLYSGAKVWRGGLRSDRPHRPGSEMARGPPAWPRLQKGMLIQS